jgi:hypothetical protein
MKKSGFGAWYSQRFMWLEFAIAVTGALAFVVWGEWYSGWRMINQVLDGNRSAVYGTAAGILGTLLGFVITVTSILLALWPEAALKLLRESGHGETLAVLMKSCMRWLAAATGAALLALLFDRDRVAQPALVYLVVLSVSIAIVRVARTIWVLENVVRIVMRRRPPPPEHQVAA